MATEFAHPLRASYFLPSGGDFYAPREWGQHAAQDYAVQPVPCYAVRAGKVLFAGWAGNAGNLIEVVGDGWKCRYIHLSRMDVKVGQAIAQGQQIGLTGNTTNLPGGVGFHLHLAIQAQTKALALTIQPDPYQTAGWWAIDPQRVLGKGSAPSTPPVEEDELAQYADQLNRIETELGAARQSAINVDLETDTIVAEWPWVRAAVAAMYSMLFDDVRGDAPDDFRRLIGIGQMVKAIDVKAAVDAKFPPLHPTEEEALIKLQTQGKDKMTALDWRRAHAALKKLYPS